MFTGHNKTRYNFLSHNIELLQIEWYLNKEKLQNALIQKRSDKNQAFSSYLFLLNVVIDDSDPEVDVKKESRPSEMFKFQVLCKHISYSRVGRFLFMGRSKW
jgi:hypothetical protein